MKRASRAASLLLAAGMVTQAGLAATGCTPVRSPMQAPSPTAGGHA